MVTAFFSLLILASVPDDSKAVSAFDDTKSVEVSTPAGTICFGVCAQDLSEQEEGVSSGPKDLEVGMVVPLDLSKFYAGFVELRPFFVQRVEQNDDRMEPKNKGVGLKITFGKPEDQIRWFVRAKVFSESEAAEEGLASSVNEDGPQSEMMVGFEIKFGGTDEKKSDKLGRIEDEFKIVPFKVFNSVFERASQGKLDLNERRNIHAFILTSYIHQVRIYEKIPVDQAISREQIYRWMVGKYNMQIDIIGGTKFIILGLRPNGRIEKDDPRGGFLNADQMIEDFFSLL